ncbi:hypothetical protein UK82_05350 [Frankia sp. ACN1ag]|nr:hypothetical protein UK82_05350 [Frankia sp. ACN1ag]
MPESWFTLDLRSGTAMRSIDPLVHARSRGTPMLAGRRAVMSAVLRDAARSATASGAVYCGVMVEAIDDAGLSATVSVSSFRHDAGPGESVPTVSALVLGLQEEPLPSLSGTWRKVQIVDLPAVGLAARVLGVLASGGGLDIEPTLVASMRTLIPVPGAPRVAQVECRSPNIAVTNALHRLFDAVTATFRFVPDGPDFRAPV